MWLFIYKYLEKHCDSVYEYQLKKDTEKYMDGWNMGWKDGIAYREGFSDRMWRKRMTGGGA